MQEHERWLNIAIEDLNMAKLALTKELFSPLTYHCQQTAEKALKAYLIYNKQAVIKTHDLTQLLELCIKQDLNFKKLYEQSKQLNPFSSKFRYPTEYDIPDNADAKLAIKHAKYILTFVIKKISEPDTGQVNIFK